MNSEYIYAGTYAQVLQHGLLSTNQRELLVSSTSLPEIKTTLQDSFAAAAFARTVTTSDFYNALDEILLEAKVKLTNITPDPALLQIIWLQYDFYNLKHLIKADMRTDGSTYVPTYTALGTYKASTLRDALAGRRLAFVDDRLRVIADQFRDPQSKISIDAEADKAYLVAAYDIAVASKSEFAISFVKLLIDLFNLRSRLRTITHQDSTAVTVHDTFVPNGTIPAYTILTTEQTLNRFADFGGKSWWEQAITAYHETNDFTDIDTAADNYVLRWLKTKSLTIHSEASLFAYFYSVRENTQFIRTVVTACNTRIDETTLRRLLRKSLNSYAY